MEVKFSSERLKADLENGKFLTRKYGEENCKKIILRIRDLGAVESFAVLEKLPGHWEPLSADRYGFWSVRLAGALRLIVKPEGVEVATVGSQTDWRKVRIVIVEKIEDYHK